MEKQCKYCHKLFTSTRKCRKYCNEHTGAWRKTGRELTRSKVRERDGNSCQDCLKKWEEGTRQFDVHHLYGVCGKKSRGYDRVADMDGLITLCHKCHFNRHDWAGLKNIEKKAKALRPRNMLIISLREKGQSYRHIGIKFGLSHEGVRLIYHQYLKQLEKQR